MHGNDASHHELKPSVVVGVIDVEKGTPSDNDRLEHGGNANLGHYEASCGKEGPVKSPASTPGIGTAGLKQFHKYPLLLIGPVILFCLLTGLCTFGVVYAAKDSYDMEQRRAKDAALSAADGLAKQLSSASRTALSMVAVVKVNPDWPFLESRFDELSKELFRQSEKQSQHEDSLGLMQLALLPFGRVRALKSKYFDSNVTYDVFSPEHIHAFKPVDTINAGTLYIDGPNLLSNGVSTFMAGYPIFFSDTDEDQSWGHPDNISHPTGCPGPPCYYPETREKFWGFAAAVVNAESTLAGDSVHLNRLLSDDLSYTLTVSNPGWDRDKTKTFVSGGPNPEKVSANVTVGLPGNAWALSVYNPRLDEIVNLRKGLVAMVVVVSFILSGLLSLLLFSSKRASVLLHEQLVTNKLLHEEKESREALLGRQLDLIACFEQNTKANEKKTSGQQNTLGNGGALTWL
ncbi:hypothetical protein DUNSADRAFT_7386 [Dunaliella salina]|uniref:CHASE domain-containing protein n=1 Tax=Dunaliella salina TaxID=3046 RepID=A0ABQ7H6B5_DUNSA|nr:hypothetical protein DUNSADRAFT_7386 [Dunaliella salina]|eukprot:KAF5842402.1 hypothetical protein DUNSADRAFT_7386 [Dunaliella salina]